jgi:hypothetical protein
MRFGIAAGPVVRSRYPPSSLRDRLFRLWLPLRVLNAVNDSMSDAEKIRVTPREARADDLFSLLDLLEKESIRVWVHGGWALDAVCGSRRQHADIDLIADEADRGRVKRLFGENVKSDHSHKFEVNFHGAKTDFLFFRRNWLGRLAARSPRILIRLRREWFGDRTAPLDGRVIPVVDPEMLYVEVVGNPELKKPAMLEKNRHDLERLAPLLSADTMERSIRVFPLPNTRLNRLRFLLGF